VIVVQRQVNIFPAIPW